MKFTMVNYVCAEKISEESMDNVNLFAQNSKFLMAKAVSVLQDITG